MHPKSPQITQPDEPVQGADSTSLQEARFAAAQRTYLAAINHKTGERRES